MIDQRTQDRLWESRQTREHRQGRQNSGRLKFLLRQIVNSGRAGEVLNIGIGAGDFEQLAIAAGLRVASLDPSAAAVATLQQLPGWSGEAEVGHVQAMPFADHRFTFVVASEVFEHLTDDVLHAGLAEIRRVLVPGGLLLGTTPAREDLSELQIECPCCGVAFHRWGHVQSFDAARLLRLLAERFEVLTVRERYFPAWDGLNWRGRIIDSLKMTLAALGSHGAGNYLYFAARKR